MSGTEEPAPDIAPKDEHVDTPAQAEVRQIIETDGRVSHVGVTEDEANEPQPKDGSLDSVPEPNP